MLNLKSNTLRRLSCLASLSVLLAAAPATADVCTCAGDMNFDGLIDGADLGALLGDWGSDGSMADLNGDGTVDGADLGAMLGQWGPCGVPMNDSCTNAINITAGTYPYCTLLASEGTGTFTPAECGGILAIYKDIWFNYTADATGPVTFSTCDNADYDTAIAVYGMGAPGVAMCSGAGQGTLLGCNDDDLTHCPDGTSTLTIQATAGYIYSIRLGGFAGGGTGRLTVAPGVPGSSCLNFIAASNNLVTTTIVGNTQGSSNAADFPQACQGGVTPGAREWIRWVAPCTGSVIATTCNGGTEFDTVLTVVHQFPGASCWSNYVTCNDDTDLASCQLGGFSRKSRTQFPVVAGHIYFIVVSGYAGSQGTYELTITRSCN